MRSTKSSDAFADTEDGKSFGGDDARGKTGNTCRFFITWFFNCSAVSADTTVGSISRTMLVENSTAA